MGWNKAGEREENNKTHTWFAWHDDDDPPGVVHNEVYDVDEQGDMTNVHYTQVDHNTDTQVTYNYHTNEWTDNSTPKS